MRASSQVPVLLIAWAAAVGCASSPPPVADANEAGANDATAPDELAMREPGAAPAESPSGTELGELAPVPAGGEADVPEPEPATAEQAPPEPIEVADDAARRAFPLSEGDLVLPGGLTIHRVPRGVQVFQVGDRSVWEIAAANGRRLALVREVSWSTATVRDGSALVQKAEPVRLRATRRWGSASVPVVVDRFNTDTHVYTLERRARGTDWIPSGLELAE